jgi:putative peptidoglycan lipid II flippase
VSGSLSALALGLVGETLFVISTQAAYARGDARTPLRSMVLQAVVCCALAAPAGLVGGRASVTLLGGAFAVASIVGGLDLSRRVHAGLPAPAQRLWPSVRRTVSASVAMAAVAWAAAALTTATLDGPVAPPAAGVVGTVAGLAVYLAVHRSLGSVELTWLRDGARGAPAVPESSPA